MPEVRGKRSRRPFGQPCAWLVCLCVSLSFSFDALPAAAAVKSPEQVTARAGASEHGGSSLETAAAKAGSTGRAVPMSLIRFALSVAAPVRPFRPDFQAAVGAFA